MKRWGAGLYNSVAALDRLVLVIVEKFALLVTEYLDLTQHQLEVLLLVLYALLSLVSSRGKYMRYADMLLGGAIALMLMGLLQVNTSSVRRHRRNDVTWVLLRTFMLVAFLISSYSFIELVYWLHRAHWLYKLTVYDIGMDLRSLDLTLFYYLAAIDSNGTPGRRRKLAMAKLRSLFGTSWLPDRRPV